MQSASGQTAPESTLFLTALAAGYRPQSLGERHEGQFSSIWFLLHSYSTGNLASLATDGRWVVYGLMGGPEVFSSSWHFCCLLTVVVCVAYWLTMGSVSSKLQARTQHGCQQSSSTVTVSSPVTPLPCFVQYIFITILSLMTLVRCQVLCSGVFYEKGLQ